MPTLKTLYLQQHIAIVNYKLDQFIVNRFYEMHASVYALNDALIERYESRVFYIVFKSVVILTSYVLIVISK